MNMWYWLIAGGALIISAVISLFLDLQEKGVRVNARVKKSSEPG